MEPAKKNPQIRDFQSKRMGEDVESTIRRDVCISCKKPATAFRDALSTKEFTLSGLCQECQDRVFADPDEENPETDDPIELMIRRMEEE